MMKKFFLCLIAFFALFTGVFSAEIVTNKVDVMKAQVDEVALQTTEIIPGTNTEVTTQILFIIPLEGELKGNRIEVRNDYLPLKKGDKFYLTRTTEAETGEEMFAVGDVYRINKLLVLTMVFVIVVLFFGGIQGARGLLSLLGSLAVIIYILLPGVLNGLSPLWLSISAASLIIVIGSYVTHGFNKTTSSAVIGMIVTVMLTGFLAWFAVGFAGLTGFESEEAVYLNFNTGGSIDFAGLLLGEIIIGLLGVLYDAAIGQSVAVEELYRAGEHMNSRHVYNRAIRIGREHIGALVNTLAIAYVGASLPLLLLFFGSDLSASIIINKEHFASEIVRTLVGSIGLVLTVPITTFVAVLMLKSFRGKGGVSDHSHSHF